LDRKEARGLRNALRSQRADASLVPAIALREEVRVALVSLVNDAMVGRPGIAGRLFQALSQADVNVVAIAQGSDELRITCCVLEQDRAVAERAIRSEFLGSK
jgi:aspartokinase